METQVKTPQKLFALPQYLNVPLFQRPYVWKEEEQWAPLWHDVRRMAELRGSTAPEATHFLGAVVLQQQKGGAMGDAEAYSVIDGQQRLTTLQLLMDATAAALEAADLLFPARKLQTLTHNSADLGFEGANQLKVRHSNRDGTAYAEVMSAEPPITYTNLVDSRITQAHEFFALQVAEWIGDGDHATERAESLASTLMHGLQLVVITLSAVENSQEIFETLNARGTPLTSADLVKNLVFQRLEAEGGDTHLTYEKQWKYFERKFWEDEVRIGRLSMDRLSLFLNHWMVAQAAEEISTRSTFTRFKHWVDHETTSPMADILTTLQHQAQIYERWTEASARRSGNLDEVELFFYRTKAAGIEAIKPIVLRLFDVERPVPAESAARGLAAVESWLMRRLLVGASSGDVSRTIAALIQVIDTGDDAEAGVRIKEFLARQSRPGTYWPTDSEVREVLLTSPAYRAMPRSRLRAVLEAVEDHWRGFTGDKPSKTGSRVDRDVMSIEHLLPQRWHTHWPVETLSDELKRDAHVHRIGNLTLLTSSLNSSVSNGPWQGKRQALVDHDALLMTRTVREIGDAGWDESQIDARSGHMADALIATWSVPEGHTVTVEKRGASEPARDVSVKELVARGLLEPGTVLTGREGKAGEARATVTQDGRLKFEDQSYGSPSGAGKAVLGRSVNGWFFWRLDDGRKLVDLKNALLLSEGQRAASAPASQPPIDE